MLILLTDWCHKHGIKTMDANGRMLRRCPECRKEHGGTKKREWWTGEEYWEEGVSAGGDEGLNVPIMPKENTPPCVQLLNTA